MKHLFNKQRKQSDPNYCYLSVYIYMFIGTIQILNRSQHFIAPPTISLVLMYFSITVPSDMQLNPCCCSPHSLKLMRIECFENGLESHANCTPLIVAMAATYLSIHPIETLIAQDQSMRQPVTFCFPASKQTKKKTRIGSPTNCYRQVIKYRGMVLKQTSLRDRWLRRYHPLQETMLPCSASSNVDM